MLKTPSLKSLKQSISEQIEGYSDREKTIALSTHIQSISLMVSMYTQNIQNADHNSDIQNISLSEIHKYMDFLKFLSWLMVSDEPISQLKHIPE